MIKTEIKNGIVHTYSDVGIKIRIKGTRIEFYHAYESEKDDHRHVWEEVPPAQS